MSGRSAFIAEVRGVMRKRHMAASTEKSYIHWIRRYLKHCKYQSREAICVDDVGPFLTHLAVVDHVSARTQNQALSALILLFRHVLGQDVPRLEIEWAKEKKTLPVVLSQGEVAHLLRYVRGEKRLIVQLLYGCGMRLGEALKLRVKDVDFAMQRVAIWDAKHGGARYVPLPGNVMEDLRYQIDKVERLHNEDIAQGGGDVYLPDALARKYPRAPWEFMWQYVFPAYKLSRDPKSGVVRRHHLYPTGVQRAVKQAATQAGIRKHVKSHTFRHSYATHLYERGVPLERIQTLLGHRDIKQTMIYVHLADVDDRSPLDDLVEDTHIKCVDI